MLRGPWKEKQNESVAPTSERHEAAEPDQSQRTGGWDGPEIGCDQPTGRKGDVSIRTTRRIGGLVDLVGSGRPHRNSPDTPNIEIGVPMERVLGQIPKKSCLPTQPHRHQSFVLVHLSIPHERSQLQATSRSKTMSLQEVVVRAGSVGIAPDAAQVHVVVHVHEAGALVDAVAREGRDVHDDSVPGIRNAVHRAGVQIRIHNVVGVGVEIVLPERVRGQSHGANQSDDHHPKAIHSSAFQRTPETEIPRFDAILKITKQANLLVLK